MWPPLLGRSGLIGRARERCAICAPNSRQPWITPHRLTPMMRSQSAGPVSRNGPLIVIPALLTTMSGTRCPSRTAAANSSIAAASATSTRQAVAAGPRAPASVAVRSAAEPSMSAAITVAPRSARASAVARPKPLPAPVTTASAPSKGARGMATSAMSGGVLPRSPA